MELMKLMEDWSGYVSLNDVVRGDGYEQKLKAVVDLLSNAANLPPHRHEYLLREALTTSDFPIMFGDVLDRQVLAAYKATEPVWKKFMKQSTVPDFRTARRFAISGGDEVLARVAEKGEYLTSDRDEDQYYFNINKYGRQFDISWEAIINDDLDALKDTPMRFAKAALRTEHFVASTLYVHNNALFTGANNNQSANPLTIANLELGLEQMAAFLDVGGNPIISRAKYLVIPPALELTARQILTSASKMWVATTNVPATAVAYPTTNVVSNYGLELVIDPYITIIDAAGARPLSSVGSWYLFSDPSDIAALEVAHLRGHERPEICMKASDKVTVGGGAIGPMSGDFATDNIFYRVRLCFGGLTLDWRGGYMGGNLD
ncbi:MAG: hypothetical protein KAS32_17450 [Candidatus Peribacteraceae bacterium]|nr:hypothetical protein [Candidatus Peribacteraceae bacterium]